MGENGPFLGSFCVFYVFFFSQGSMCCCGCFCMWHYFHQN